MQDDDAIDAQSDSDDEDFQMENSSGEDTGKDGSDDSIDKKDGWISWFTSLDGHEYLVQVDEEYISDPFNLYGLMTHLGKDKFK